MTSSLLAMAGLAVSAYLAYEHATGSTSLACSDTGRVDCLKVTTSTYSVVLGVPVAYLGVAYYAAIAALMTPLGWRRLPAYVHVAATASGLLFVLYLVWAEFFRLNAICLWCSTVHLLTFLLFAVTLIAEALRE